MAIKWDAFTSAGELTTACQVVGLTGATLNARFDFPGTGIKDSNGVYLVRWLPPVGTASNYLTLASTTTGNAPTITGSGADGDVGVSITAKGNGNITLTTGALGYVIASGVSAMKLPIGTTAQRPTGVAGLLRYNSDTGSFESWSTASSSWVGVFSSIIGTTNRITVTGTSPQQVDISGSYVGQSTITTLGTVTTGVWNGTAVDVAHGGTGLTSIAAQQVVCGGASSVGSLQTVTGVGLIGQVLGSQGASKLPAWQTLMLPSYLIGWDFRLNPAQFGSTQAASGSANTSKYVWDQTMMFQDTASGIGVTRNTSTNALVLTNPTGGAVKTAVIQYLGAITAREILANLLSVQVSGCTSGSPVNFTVSLWYTTTGTTPSISLVATLDANGKPATFNGTWVEIPVAVGFGFSQTGTMPTGTNNAGAPTNLSYFDTTGLAGATTAAYFAIVVGFAPLAAAASIDLRYVSLNAGTMSTAPALKTEDEVRRECQYFYQKSYADATAVGTATTVGQKCAIQVAVSGGGNTATFELILKSMIRQVPTISTWSPATGAASKMAFYYTDTGGATTNVADKVLSGFTQASSTGVLNTNAVSFLVTTWQAFSGTNVSAYLTYHYEADARYGVI